MMTILNLFSYCFNLRLRKVLLTGPYSSTLLASRLMNIHNMSPTYFQSMGLSSGNDFSNCNVVCGQFWKYSWRSKEQLLAARSFLDMLDMPLIELSESKLTCLRNSISSKSFAYSCLFKICSCVFPSLYRLFSSVFRPAISSYLPSRVQFSSFCCFFQNCQDSANCISFSLRRWYSSTILASLSTSNWLSVLILLAYSLRICEMVARTASFTFRLSTHSQPLAYTFINLLQSRANGFLRSRQDYKSRHQLL